MNKDVIQLLAFGFLFLMCTWCLGVTGLPGLGWPVILVLAIGAAIFVAMKKK